MATYSMASDDTRDRPSRRASSWRSCKGAGPSATSSSKAPRKTFWRKPTSNTTNLIENAPMSMPQTGWAMGLALLLSPVLQRAGRLLRRHVHAQGVLDRAHGVDDGGDLLLHLAGLAGGDAAVGARWRRVGDLVQRVLADRQRLHARQHAVAGSVGQHRGLRLRQHRQHRVQAVEAARRGPVA